MIAQKGGILVCGGLSGVMAAAARGAKEAGGTTIGILPGTKPEEANADITIPIPTGLGEGRNLLVVQSSDAVIAVGGGAGTLSEIGFCMKLNKPLILLESWQLKPPVGHRMPAHLERATSPQQAVILAFQTLEG